jgi:hypothetical protein
MHRASLSTPRRSRPMLQWQMLQWQMLQWQMRDRSTPRWTRPCPMLHCSTPLCLIRAAPVSYQMRASPLPMPARSRVTPRLQDAASPIVDLGTKALLDLTDVKQNPEAYEWFDFRPNVKKLILAGAAETEHIAILWYTVTDGAVGLHYHSKTECVYVIDGTQTDAKGVYPTGTVYYNPPTSGHAISDSSGFFLLSYAAPPDFASTDLIEDYTPVRIDTEDPDLMTEYAFDTDGGVSTYAVPLQSEGGMSSEFIALDGDEGYAFSGNYVLVLEGTCEIEGVSLGEDSLVVTDAVEPEMFSVSSTDGASCLALGISF